MKKAEILISVSKSKTENGVSEVTCDYNRGVDFEPFDMFIDGEGIPKVKGAVKKKQKYCPSLESEPKDFAMPINKQFDAEEEYLSKFDNPPAF